MRDRSKAEEILHYFNINSEIDSLYGNWAVAKNGDVVNYLYPYAILAIHLDDNNWMETISKKVWFKEECKKDLRKAIERAYRIVNNK